MCVFVYKNSASIQYEKQSSKNLTFRSSIYFCKGCQNFLKQAFKKQKQTRIPIWSKYLQKNFQPCRSNRLKDKEGKHRWFCEKPSFEKTQEKEKLFFHFIVFDFFSVLNDNMFSFIMQIKHRKKKLHFSEI